MNKNNTTLSWEVANKRALDDAEKFGRTPTQKDVNRKYFAMFGSIEREGKNTPIQGGNADIAKTGMGSGSDKNGNPFMWHLLPNYNFTTPDGTAKDARK
jgi:hypothetical protein